MKVNVLGTEYTVVTEASIDKYPSLEGVDGYCDYSAKEIVVRKKDSNDDIGDFNAFINKVMRHEIIHAYFYESGLYFDQTERMVDWIAIQIPKMSKLFDEMEIS